jgi:phospholipase/lecithinase/hemolysin
VRLQGPAAQAAGQWLSSSYNDGLEATLSALEGALPVTIVRLDVYTLVNQVVAMPGVYGLAEVERTCITPGVRRGAYCSRPDDYLFWDGIHPTRAGHAILAHGARAALP